MAERTGITISFYTDQENRRMLKQIAKAQRRSVSNLLTGIVQDFIARHSTTATQPGNGKHAETVDYSQQPG